MRVLLDTNALWWLIDRPENSRLGKSARAAILDAELLYVSSISIVEIRIKTMIGKAESRPDLMLDITRAGCRELVFSSAHADMLLDFPQLARHDPFDRMLLAQAAREGLIFLTADEVLLGLGLAYVRDARV